MSVSALSRNSSKDLLAKLQKQVTELKQSNSSSKDDRFWQPTADASGVGSAVLRFLPAKYDDDLPFAKTYRHAFQEGTSWFIDNCPTTIGQECPVCAANGKLWNSGLDADKEVARKRKRRLEYIANVLVLKDPGNKENEGQIKLFRFGAKIWEKVEECFSPDPDTDDEPMNPFGFFGGGNFNLKIANVAGYRNYDKSKFVSASDLYDGDEDKLTELLDKLHDLKEFTDPKNFKSYEDMDQRFLKVTGQVGGRIGGSVSIAEDDAEEFVPAKTPAKEVGAATKSTKAAAATTESSIDDDLAFLQDLAKDSF